MQKEADLLAHTHLAQLSGDVHQVIIVDPDEVVGAEVLLDRPGKLAVYGAIRSPEAGVEVAPHVQIVEKRPDDFVREPAVEPVTFLGGQRYRGEMEPGCLAGIRQHRVDVEGSLLARAGPADPQSPTLAQHR